MKKALILAGLVPVIATAALSERDQKLFELMDQVKVDILARQGQVSTDDTTPHARAIKALDAKDWDRFAYWAELTDYSQWDVRIKSGLGHCYRQGLGGKPQDGKRAFDLLSEAVRYADTAKAIVESNDVSRAMLELGICYHAGMGVASNHVEAVKWYRKAAERGYAAAQFCLGACCHHGVGVKKDIDEALKWYRKAVDGGYKDAQQSIDKILKGSEDSLTRREKNLSIREMHLVAMQLVSGIDGGKHDKKEEYELFRDIASHENDKDLGEEERECVGNALSVLGVYCLDGVPGLIKKDLGKAFDYFSRAAKFDNPVAQYNLGMCYERGDGVARDYRKSIEWYVNALDAGFEKAKGGIERIKRTPGATTKYVVRRGDAFTTIAAKHGMRLRVLRELNELKDDTIRIGQKLVVPMSNR